MTVCVAIKVHDCVVFAADSASTLTSVGADGTQNVWNVYNNADKVFNLKRSLPLVAMTCGMGHLGTRSVASLAKELRYHLTTSGDAINDLAYTVGDVVGFARQFLQEKYASAYPDPNASHYLEFWIGGYGSANDHGEIWRIVLAEGAFQAPEQLTSADQEQGVFWGGQGQAISRLLLGIDPEVVAALVDAGLEKQTAEGIFFRRALVSKHNSLTPPCPFSTLFVWLSSLWTQQRFTSRWRLALIS